MLPACRNDDLSTDIARDALDVIVVRLSMRCDRPLDAVDLSLRDDAHVIPILPFGHRVEHDEFAAPNASDRPVPHHAAVAVLEVRIERVTVSVLKPRTAREALRAKRLRGNLADRHGLTFVHVGL